MKGKDDPARRAILADLYKQANVVYGVWLDKDQPHGIDYELLKGSERLVQITRTGLPWDSRDHAIRLGRMLGTASGES